MKRNKCSAFLVGVALLLLNACTDGYESFPVDQFSEEYVFSRTDSMGIEARRFMNTIYNTLRNGHNGVGGDYLDAASDDALSIVAKDPDVYKLAIGRYTANSRVGSDMGWGTYYEGIRKANIIIANIDYVPFKTTYKNAKDELQPLNVSMKAEARFLRAYFYFELVKRYGGVPLMGDVIHQLGDDMQIPRTTFAQCIDYIVTELDDLKDDLRTLPMADATEYAHAASREAAMALKSRVLLYAASPLFNESPISFATAEQKELVGYSSYNKERWKLAADAALDFINTSGEKGSGVVKLTGNFLDVFLIFHGASNPEVIFFRQGGNDRSVESANGPLGFSGNALGLGRTNPTQNLVNAFPMKDGKSIGESTKYVYNSQNPYANRDPRLGHTVLYNGANWLGTVLATHQGGVNNPSSSAEYSKTSYYMRKFMGSFETSKEYGNSYHLWVMFRYTEILLNYAEALNEYESSPTQDIYDIIISLRRRVGIESGNDRRYGLKGNMTQSEMREVIQNERRIEMAFEEQRYWDIRRWKVAEEIFSQPLRGMSIVNTLAGPVYSTINVLAVDFDEQRYLYPIPYTEVLKNRNMVQNPKW